MPTISLREKDKIIIKYVSKAEREIIEQIKETNNYKTLKEAYFHYKQNRISFPEQIKRLETDILELRKENDELKEKLHITGGLNV